MDNNIAGIEKSLELFYFSGFHSTLVYWKFDKFQQSKIIYVY